MIDSAFAARLLQWFDVHGRHNLPWQSPRSAYAVWLSEVMLQQTQVVTVIPYFLRFMAAFPTVADLANAPTDAVMRLWAGLGYYARARNLHAAAQQVVRDFGGGFPRTVAELQQLKGVGRSTAGAIAAQAYGIAEPILDANVKRVLSRWQAINSPINSAAAIAVLWELSARLLPQQRLADYTQALMDLGATVCTARNPACSRCPIASDCQARIQARTHELPVKAAKSARARVHRHGVLVLMQDPSGQLYLRRRPAIGIWGGLWCPPMFYDDQDWRSSLGLAFGLDDGVVQAGPFIHHKFSHFDLTLTPLHLSISPSAVDVAEDNARWCAPGQIINGDWGLPAPVSKYVQQHYLLASTPQHC